jgi:hypothetical protein
LCFAPREQGYSVARPLPSAPAVPSWLANGTGNGGLKARSVTRLPACSFDKSQLNLRCHDVYNGLVGDLDSRRQLSGRDTTISAASEGPRTCSCNLFSLLATGIGIQLKIQGDTAKHIERSNEAFGLIVGTLASATRSRLGHWKSVFESLPAVRPRENFDRASELAHHGRRVPLARSKGRLISPTCFLPGRKTAACSG